MAGEDGGYGKSQNEKRLLMRALKAAPGEPSKSGDTI